MKCLQILCSEFIIDREICRKNLTKDNQKFIKELESYNVGMILEDILIKGYSIMPFKFYYKNYYKKFIKNKGIFLLALEYNRFDAIDFIKNYIDLQNININYHLNISIKNNDFRKFKYCIDLLKDKKDYLYNYIINLNYITNVDIIKYIYDIDKYIFINNRNIFYNYIKKDNLEIIKFIVSTGFTFDSDNLFERCFQTKDLDLIKYFLSIGYECNIIDQCIYTNVEIVKFFMKEFNFVPVNDKNIISKLYPYRCYDIIKFLYEELGFNINHEYMYISQCGYFKLISKN